MKARTRPEKAEYDYENRIGFRVILTAELLLQGAKTFLRPDHRMSFANWRVLVVIGARGPISAKEVVERTHQPPDRITRTVDQFEVRGWVERRRDAVDGRRVMLTATSRGKKIYDHIEDVVREAHRQTVSVLNAGELRQFDDTLRKYEQRCRELLEAPGGWRRLVERVKKKR